MTYACPVADAHLLKLQRLQNRALRAIGNLDRCTPVRELHVAFKIRYVYNYITKLCRTQTEIQDYVVFNMVKPGIGSIRGLLLAAVRPTTF
jgi:hypothetical protein